MRPDTGQLKSVSDHLDHLVHFLFLFNFYASSDPWGVTHDSLGPSLGKSSITCSVTRNFLTYLCDVPDIVLTGTMLLTYPHVVTST